VTAPVAPAEGGAAVIGASTGGDVTEPTSLAGPVRPHPIGGTSEAMLDAWADAAVDAAIALYAR
jgi:hypothetical protein